MNRWIRIVFVLLVGLGLALGSAAPDISVAAEDPSEHSHGGPAEHSHGGPEADCDDIHAARGATHGDHENHCCIAGAGGAAIFAGAANVAFAVPSAAKFRVGNDADAAGPLYGIFRPPRDAS